MNVEYINSFIEATQTVLNQTTGIVARLGKVYLRNSPYMSENIAIIVGVAGEMEGQVVFSMHRDLAIQIASKMIENVTLSDLNDLSKSALSELINIIMGNTVTILSNIGVKILTTPPSFFTGDNMQISNPKLKIICVPLILDDGNIIEMDIALTSQK